MKIISIVNQKGGVGKTTTTINLASAMAKQGRQVLVVDLDPQRNATTSLNGNKQYDGPSISDLIYFNVSGFPYSLTDFIRRSDTEQVDYIPATPMLASAPNILAQDRDSYMVLRRLLRRPEVEEIYDYILIDCKPSLDLLVGNALVAGDSVIVPVQPDDYSLDGLGDLMSTVGGIKERYNSELEIGGILITMADLRRKVTNRIIGELRDAFGELVYQTVITNLADCGNAKDQGRSAVSCGNRLGKLYTQFAEEVVWDNE